MSAGTAAAVPSTRHHPGRRIGTVLATATFGVVVAALTATEPLILLATGALTLLVAAMFRQVAILPILAMPVLLVVHRLGGDALSVSDFALFLAFWPAALLSPKPFSRPMRTVLWASALYQALTLFTVFANPYLANTVEWFHAWLLVAGALVVGWAVGATGTARTGLGLLVAAAAGVAVLTCVQWVQNVASGNFEAVFLDFPYSMHKNYIGTVLSFGAILVYARPRWLRWNDTLCLGLFGLFVTGILAAQSRQALVSLAIGVAIIALRPDPDRRRSKAVLLAVAGGAMAVAGLLRDQLESGDQFNSAYQRLVWFQASLNVWEEYPIFGAGLRWWYTDRFDEAFHPPNAEFEVLSSAGIVGLIGFLLMFLIILVVLWQVDPRYGTLAFVVVLMRFVQGQLDLFWVAAQVSIPFAIVGVCLGEHARRTELLGYDAATEEPTRGYVPPAERTLDRVTRSSPA